jgi:hypothetical protein
MEKKKNKNPELVEMFAKMRAIKKLLLDEKADFDTGRTHSRPLRNQLKRERKKRD